MEVINSCFRYIFNVTGYNSQHGWKIYFGDRSSMSTIFVRAENLELFSLWNEFSHFQRMFYFFFIYNCPGRILWKDIISNITKLEKLITVWQNKLVSRNFSVDRFIETRWEIRGTDRTKLSKRNVAMVHRSVIYLCFQFNFTIIFKSNMSNNLLKHGEKFHEITNG